MAQRSSPRALRSGMTDAEKRLDGVVFVHGGGEAGDAGARAGSFDFDAELALFLGAGFAQDDDGTEGFVVYPCDQEGLTGFQLFPKLADLQFANAHCVALNVDREVESVNWRVGRVAEKREIRVDAKCRYRRET
jgi:hypothetical protein